MCWQEQSLILPDGWRKQYSSEHGAHYYYNKETKKTQWTLPKADSSPDADEVPPPPRGKPPTEEQRDRETRHYLATVGARKVIPISNLLKWNPSAPATMAQYQRKLAKEKKKENSYTPAPDKAEKSNEGDVSESDLPLTELGGKRKRQPPGKENGNANGGKGGGGSGGKQKPKKVSLCFA